MPRFARTPWGHPGECPSQSAPPRTAGAPQLPAVAKTFSNGNVHRSAPESHRHDSRHSTWGALLVALLMSVPVLALPGAGFALESSERFTRKDVEDLALYYAVESYRRLEIPKEMRHLADEIERDRQKEIKEIKADPPKLQPNGAVHPFGPNNPVSFVLNDDGTMTVWNEMIELEGKLSRWGPTAPEAAKALNESSTRKERGDSDFAWDRTKDALSMHTGWTEVPRTKAERERFYRRTMKQHTAFMSWSEGGFVDRMNGVVGQRELPKSASSEQDGFAASLVLRHFSATGDEQQAFAERYKRVWDRPARHKLAPRIVSDRSVPQEQRFYLFFHFRGSKNNTTGISPVDATLRIRSPDGELLVEDVVVPLWRAEAKAEDFWQIGGNNVDLTLDREQAPGGYRIEADICDQTTGRCVTVVHPLELTAARR